ncbi:MAG: hypothetical protein LBT44_06815 [Clostridiales bacterium]|jgi:hypothetical protein|nr:hypothetical protein [Clostridiales bacterium]
MNEKRVLYLNAAELLDRVFELYKESFWQQLGITLSVNVIASAVFMAVLFTASFLAALYIPSITSFSGNGFSAEMAPLFLALILLAAFLLFFIALWTVFYQSAGMIVIRQVFYHQKPDLGLALKGAFRSLPRLATLVAAGFIISIPFFGLIGASVYAWARFFISGGWLETAETILLSPTYLFVFSAFLIFAALVSLIVYNYFTLAIPVTLFNRKYFFSAFVNSTRLIKGRFWKIAGIRVVFAGVIYYITNGLTLLFYLLAWMFPSAVYLAASASILQITLSMALSTLTAPLGSILTALLYFNQKVEKEGLDIDYGLALAEQQLIEQTLVEQALAERG